MIGWDLPADPAVVAHARSLALRQLAEWGLRTCGPPRNSSSANWSPTPSGTAADPSGSG
ncbi:hypothetical protein NKH77_09360 [Streptomyces sp. M19]